MSKCEFGCGREGKFIIQPHNKLCCENNISKCPSVINKLKEKIKCPNCGKLIGKTRFKVHLNLCSIEKYCLECGKLLDNIRKKFCNHSCSASFNNLCNSKNKLGINGKPEKKKIQDKYCLSCNKKLNKRQNRYCSLECQQDYQFNNKIKKWINRENYQTCTTGTMNKFIRKYLLKEANYKCSKCGWGETNRFTNTIPLEIHHSDGNWKNQSPENLIVLCPNCHSLENFHTSSNKNIMKHKNRNNYEYKKRKSDYLTENSKQEQRGQNVSKNYCNEFF